MKYRVHTRSGAMYTIDTEEGTWHRRTPTSGQGALGLTTDYGSLDPNGDPKIVIGSRLWLDTLTDGESTFIMTTPVVSAEDITE